jgi:hypothetical protein
MGHLAPQVTLAEFRAAGQRSDPKGPPGKDSFCSLSTGQCGDSVASNNQYFGR